MSKRQKANDRELPSGWQSSIWHQGEAKDWAFEHFGNDVTIRTIFKHCSEKMDVVAKALMKDQPVRQDVAMSMADVMLGLMACGGLLGEDLGVLLRVVRAQYPEGQ